MRSDRLLDVMHHGFPIYFAPRIVSGPQTSVQVMEAVMEYRRGDRVGGFEIYVYYDESCW